ncbi:MAG: carboxypeptidase regulatory-like domain-containing protein [Bacteroidetes bacterium]|nr:carboxypeptidase regulatory-like domain-containing protein [Bacteroidota bacterium]
MTKKLRYLFLMVFMGVSGAAFAQTGAISGTVIDEHKEPIIGAVVQVFQAGAQRGGDVTDMDGKYTVKPLQPGANYEVRVNYASYRQIILKNVIVSPDRTTYQNFKMEVNTREMQEVVVKEYKVPLIKKDEPGSTTTFTSEQIAKMPTRNTSDIASQSAGTYQQKSGAGISIAGARTGGTQYIVDGILLNGSNGTNLPPGAIEQMSVITSGIPAKYGDASGGIINITTRGGAPKHTGDIGYEHSVDGYNRNYLYFSVAGPLLKRKIDSLNKRNVLGYSLSGNYVNTSDNDPNYFPNYVLKGDKLKEIQDHPLVQVTDISGRKTARSAAEYVRMSDMETTKRRVNANAMTARLVGKVDYQLAENVNVTVGGNFEYQKYRDYDRRYSLFSPDAIPTATNTNGRGFIRLTQRFGKPNLDASDKDKRPVISNAFYSIQADYQVNHFNRQDPNLKHNIFEYGYVGKFDIQSMTLYGAGYDDSIGRIGTTLLAYNAPTKVNYTRSNLNPLLANYTSQYYDMAGSDAYPRTLNDIMAGKGMLNGMQPDYVYSRDIAFNSGYQIGGYGYSDQETFTFNAEASFDFQPKKTRHAIEFGLLYQQRSERSYNITGASATNSIWARMRQLTNAHILNLDKTNPIYIINGRQYTLNEYRNSGLLFGPYDTVMYNRNYDPTLQSTFDYNLRKKLGLNPKGTDYLNVDSYDPSTFSLDMFSPDEIINSGDNLASYYGYDYTGKRLNGQVNFNDWFTKKDANGNYTRNLGAFRPNYIAGYIQDKFELPHNVLFNVGVRVERFDANTKVLKDPYSLYATNTVATSNAINPNGKTPDNIGSNYVVYVKDNASTTPTVVGYRNGDDWYDANGKYLVDPTILKDVVGGDPQPYLVRTSADGKRALMMNDKDYDPNTSFTDYKPQVNVAPRINFTFPIAEQSMFYAHYDVYVMRPKSASDIYVSPVDYYFLNKRAGAGAILNNPDLKPEKVFDYELGFQQVLSQNSAVTINGFYKERKDMIQVRPYLLAYPNTYYTLGNRDFMTYKGFSMKYDLRRVNHLQLQMAYTLQFSEGTGSSSSSSNGGNANTVSSSGLLASLIGYSQPMLRFTYPLNNDSRHILTANLDYRFDKGEGPIVGKKHILENAGINLIVRARSGEPYTRYMYPGQRVIVGGVQGSRLPWHYGMDLRIDKTFALTHKAGSRLGLQAFIYIQNLLNTREILGVYGYTGRPDDDGWIASPQGKQDASTKTDPLSYGDLYNWSRMDPSNLNNPRRINLGISLSF